MVPPNLGFDSALCLCRANLSPHELGENQEILPDTQFTQLRETITRLEEVQDDPDALLTADEEFHALMVG